MPARQVGIIHTSYRELSKRNAGLVMAGVSALLNSWLCAIHCHKVRHWLLMAGVSALLNSWRCAIHCHKVHHHALALQQSARLSVSHCGEARRSLLNWASCPLLRSKIGKYPCCTPELVMWPASPLWCGSSAPLKAALTLLSRSCICCIGMRKS